MLDALERRADPALNELDRFGSHDRMDPALSMPLGDLDEAEVASTLRLSWALSRSPSRQGDVRRKTHRAWVPAADGYPAPWQPSHARAVYIVRDPRGVVASWAHHLSVSVAAAAELMATSYSDPRRADAHGDEALTSWSTHVTSWIDDCSLPLLVLRYEDMADNAVNELSRVVEFLDIESTVDELTAAVDSCTFERLAVREVVEGFREAAAPGRAFFRRGDANAWRTEVPDEIQQRIVRDHETVMERLGYLP